MTAVKKIRLALGLTQPQLAEYLSITLGQLAMAETGQRFLPTKALLKLDVMEQCLAENTPATATAYIQNQSAETHEMLLARAKECDYLAMLATQKLEAMCSHYEQCINLLKLSSLLLEDLPASEETTTDMLCLEVMQHDARKKMQRCSPGAQALLQLEADACLYHAQQARAMMG